MPFGLGINLGMSGRGGASFVSSVTSPAAFGPYGTDVQFTAVASGPVTWSVQNGGGSIDSNGLYTPGGSLPFITIRAALTANPSVYAETVWTMTSILYSAFTGTNGDNLATHTLAPVNAPSAFLTKFAHAGTITGTIQTNAAQVLQAAGTGTGGYYANLGVVPTSGSAQIKTGHADATVGVIIRWIDSDNFIAIDWYQSGDSLRVLKREAGSFSVVAGSGAAGTGGGGTTGTFYTLTWTDNGTTITAQLGSGTPISSTSSFAAGTKYGGFGTFNGAANAAVTVDNLHYIGAAPVVQTFGASFGKIAKGGPWVNTGDYCVARGSPNLRCGLDFAATGTSLTLKLHNATTPNSWTLVVDGVETTPTVPADTVTEITVFSGAHATRQIKLRTTAGVTCKVPRVAFGVLTGSPATSARVAYRTNFGAVHPLVDPLNSVNNILYLPVDGSMLANAGWADGYANTYQHANGSCGSIRFKATCAAIQLFATTGNDDKKVRLAIDGVLQAGEITLSAADPEWHTIATGLDSAAEHTYTIYSSGQDTGDADENYDFAWYPWGISVDGSVNTATLTVLEKVAFFGDSITAGAGSSLSNPGGSFALGAAIYAATTGCRNAGLPFRPVRDAGLTAGFRPGKTDYADATAYSPADLFILLGVNDILEIFAAWNAGAFETDFGTMLAGMRTALPTAHLHVAGILPLGTSFAAAEARRAAANTAIQAAITAQADANMFYEGVCPGFVAATHTNDDLHPNDAGVALLSTWAGAVVGNQ